MESKTEADGCIDCGKEGGRYAVKKEVWDEAFPDYKAVREQRRAAGKATTVCLECLEKRLGRQLRMEDFTDARINQPIFYGYKIAMRSF